jgi:hypothetical protein
MGKNRAPLVEGHIWAAKPPVNGFFQRFSPPRRPPDEPATMDGEGAEKDPAEKGRTLWRQDKPPKRVFKAPIELIFQRFTSRLAAPKSAPSRRRAGHLERSDRPCNPFIAALHAGIFTASS